MLSVLKSYTYSESPVNSKLGRWVTSYTEGHGALGAINTTVGFLLPFSTATCALPSSVERVCASMLGSHTPFLHCFPPARVVHYTESNSTLIWSSQRKALCEAKTNDAQSSLRFPGSNSHHGRGTVTLMAL